MNSSSAPPPLSKREQASQDKHQRILQAAVELFAERGFHGTAVPEVAQLANVGAGTIYRYFDNKEALVNAVFVDAKNLLKEYLSRDLEDNEALPIKEKFHSFWQNLVQFAAENPVQFHFLELQDHACYLDKMSRQVELQVLAPIWLALEDGKKRGIIKDLPTDAMMAMVWGAFVGLMKAKTLGYAKLDEDSLGNAEQLCWQMIATPGN